MDSEFDIFEGDSEVRRYNCLETLRLKGSLLGRDIQNLVNVDCFESYNNTLLKAVSKWFSQMNDFFDILEGATYSKKA